VWIVWIDDNNPHIWDKAPRLSLDVGLIRFNRHSLHCGQILRRFPTGYPQIMGIMRIYYILDDSKTTPHIWGVVFG
jgi:hypothetical protein